MQSTQRIDLKRGAGDIVSLWVMAALIGLLPLFFLVLGVWMISTGDSIGYILLLFAAPMLALLALVVNEGVARQSVRVTLDSDSIHLRLPKRRGYIAFEPVNEAVSRAALAAVETRAEAYRGLGTIAIQRVFALVLKDGRRIMLGADRPMIAPFFAEAANTIAAQTNLPIRDLGMVDGKTGFLLIAGASAPPWDAPALAPATAKKRAAHAAWGLRIALWIALGALAISALARLGG